MCVCVFHVINDTPMSRSRTWLVGLLHEIRAHRKVLQPVPMKRPRFGYEVRPISCTFDLQMHHETACFELKRGVLARGFLFIQLY